MKLLVCGSRSLKDKNIEIEKCLDKFAKGKKITEIISGMAQGPDLIGAFWAEEHNIYVKQFPAKWDDLDSEGATVITKKNGVKYNKNAGLQRNKQMLKEGKPDFVLAFLDGRTEKSNGTRHMIRHSLESGVPVQTVMVYDDHVVWA